MFLRDCSLVVFVSWPVEASLSSLFRGLEVCRCNTIYLISSKRRKDEVIRLASELLNCLSRLNVNVKSLPEIPDTDVSPELLPEVVKWFRVLAKRLCRDGYVCFTASSGSRLEVSSASISLERGCVDVIYVAFLWGPWLGSYYPFTPKPLQPAVLLHEGASVTCREAESSCFSQVLPHSVKGFNYLLNSLPELRRSTLEAQLIINSEKRVAGNPCLMTANSVTGRRGCMNECGRLIIEVRTNDAHIASECSDYCSWDKVVELVRDVVKQYEEITESGSSIGSCEVISMLLDASGFRQLTLAKASEGLTELKDVYGYILSDALEQVRQEAKALLDTCVIYKGIHTQLYEKRDLRTKLAIPACALVEMYEHIAQISGKGWGRIYRELRAELAKLLVKEIKSLINTIEREAIIKPCEVGIALASRRSNTIAITADELAYENLYREVSNVPAILANPKPLTEVKFLGNEYSRRVAYAYYAVAQLKAISKRLRHKLLRADMEVKVYME